MPVVYDFVILFPVNPNFFLYAVAFVVETPIPIFEDDDEDGRWWLLSFYCSLGIDKLWLVLVDGQSALRGGGKLIEDVRVTRGRNPKLLTPPFLAAILFIKLIFS